MQLLKYKFEVTTCILFEYFHVLLLYASNHYILEENIVLLLQLYSFDTLKY